MAFLYPWGNTQQLNLNWILQQIKEIRETLPKENPQYSVINIADEILEPLSSDNFETAFFYALAKSSYIYIPAGEYSTHIELTQDCTIFLDENCHLTPIDDRTIFYAQNCSFNLYGGTLTCGEDDNSRTRTNYYLVYLQNCSNCEIKGVKSPYSKTSGVFWVDACTSVIFENCAFSNMLRAAIFFADNCKNVTVRNCYFNGSHPIAGQDYCYFVYTGVKSNSSRATPCENLIYENNYCIDSDDCGLDTHGATNVTIRGNVVLQTVCAITAYNDNARANRPAGWTMLNVLIENNYCKSDKTIPVGSAYPHPFLFLGASNTNKKSEYPTDYGTYNDYDNCVIRNNYFETANNFSSGSIYLSQTTRNLTFDSNTINLIGIATADIYFKRSFMFKFINNNVIGKRLKLTVSHGCGQIRDNIGIRLDYSNSYVSYYYGTDITQGYVAPPTVKMGDLFYASSELRQCTSYGLRERLTYADAIRVFNITVADGIATCDDNVYIPDLALSLTGDSSINAYITDVLDYESFSIRNASGNPVPDGNYVATIRDHTFTAV